MTILSEDCVFFTYVVNIVRSQVRVSDLAKDCCNSGDVRSQLCTRCANRQPAKMCWSCVARGGSGKPRTERRFYGCCRCCFRYRQCACGRFNRSVVAVTMCSVAGCKRAALWCSDCYAPAVLAQHNCAHCRHCVGCSSCYHVRRLNGKNALGESASDGKPPMLYDSSGAWCHYPRTLGHEGIHGLDEKHRRVMLRSYAKNNAEPKSVKRRAIPTPLCLHLAGNHIFSNCSSFGRE